MIYPRYDKKQSQNIDQVQSNKWDNALQEQWTCVLCVNTIWDKTIKDRWLVQALIQSIHIKKVHIRRKPYNDAKYEKYNSRNKTW